MEYVDGEGSCFGRCRIGGLSPDKATEIARQLRGACSSTNAEVIHRDLKTANVYARGAGQKFASPIRTCGNRCKHQGRCRPRGDPWYMAPEQIAEAAESGSSRRASLSLGLILTKSCRAKTRLSFTIPELLETARSPALITILNRRSCRELDPLIENSVILRAWK